MELFSLAWEDAPYVYKHALMLCCFHSLISAKTFRRALTVSVDSFSGITSSGWVWKKEPESDAWSVQRNMEKKVSPIKGDVDIPSFILLKRDGIRERHVVHVIDPTIIVGIVDIPLLLVLGGQPAADGSTYELLGSCTHCKCGQKPDSCPVIELVNCIVVTDFTPTC